VLAGLTQFIHMNISMPEVKFSDLKEKSNDPKEDMMKSFQVYMKYGLPVMVFALLGTIFNAAIGLYWVTLNIFMILQERAVRRDKETLKEMNKGEIKK
jgi:membrane protein insertase Oxa1/YidC/SpoIIIJ